MQKLSLPKLAAMLALVRIYASVRDLPRLPLPDLQARHGLSFDVPVRALARWNAGISAKDDEKTISIYDPIGYDPWTGDGVTPKRISSALREFGAETDIVVNINSPGGDVFDGMAIYNLLRDHKGKVTTRVVGLAASAASVIAMAGDEIQIARAGFMMVHNVWVFAIGNRNDLRDAADLLEPFDDALASVYAIRSGVDKTEVAKMMDKETWLSGEQAIDKGFADALVPADQVDEKEAAKASAASTDRRVMDMALARAGLSRSERRALMNRIKPGTPSAAEPIDRGTPRAAPDAMRNAGDAAEAVAVIERMTSRISTLV